MTRTVTEIEHLGGDRYAVSDGAHLVRVRVGESGYVYILRPDGTCSVDGAALARWPDLFTGSGGSLRCLTDVGKSLFAGARVRP